MKLFTDIQGNVMQVLGYSTAANAFIEIDGTAASVATTNAISAKDEVVMLCSTSNVRIAFGATPVAIATGILLPAGAMITVHVRAGHKIAVLGGKLSIAIMD